jgi:hypothetical protein
VSFSDPPVKFDKADVDRVLSQSQHQDGLLMRLEKEMERNKEYLTKVCMQAPCRHRTYFSRFIYTTFDFQVYILGDELLCYSGMLIDIFRLSRARKTRPGDQRWMKMVHLETVRQVTGLKR